MKFDVLQVLGMVVLVVSAQGAIRLLVDHSNTGLLSWLPGGFPAVLAVYLVAVVAGAALAWWSHDRAKARGRRG
ncbi:hypothetical protein [Saccharothrix variisporea]|uniref:Uncharacterized protein n=1 Tax=Saccharothrix variisporea TaxID=543527 RepID=A0A495XJW6_9PSEU|nr:hypothetical protein [Saccharothrix variisporea]RKT74242.1 hypothetical protein DFJ66_7585 [Saccharothrix variisporea]